MQVPDRYPAASWRPVSYAGQADKQAAEITRLRGEAIPAAGPGSGTMA